MQLSGGTVSTESKGIEVIEELLPLYETKILLNLKNKKIKSVVLQPQNRQIPFIQNSTTSRVSFEVEKFVCHQMIELNYV